MRSISASFGISSTLSLALVAGLTLEASAEDRSAPAPAGQTQFIGAPNEAPQETAKPKKLAFWKRNKADNGDASKEGKRSPLKKIGSIFKGKEKNEAVRPQVLTPVPAPPSGSPPPAPPRPTPTATPKATPAPALTPAPVPARPAPPVPAPAASPAPEPEPAPVPVIAASATPAAAVPEVIVATATPIAPTDALGVDPSTIPAEAGATPFVPTESVTGFLPGAIASYSDTEWIVPETAANPATGLDQSTIGSLATIKVIADSDTAYDLDSNSLVFVGNAVMGTPRFHLEGDRIRLRVNEAGNAVTSAEAVGTTTVSIGGANGENAIIAAKGAEATFDPVDHSITISGWPEVIANGTRHVAADAETMMVLYLDGRVRVQGTAIAGR